MKHALTLFKNTHVTRHRVSKSQLRDRFPEQTWIMFNICLLDTFSWHVCCYWYCVVCGMIQCGIYIYNIHSSYYVVIFSRDEFNIYTSSVCTSLGFRKSLQLSSDPCSPRITVTPCHLSFSWLVHFAEQLRTECYQRHVRLGCTVAGPR
jgi:hypothetical protein